MSDSYERDMHAEALRRINEIAANRNNCAWSVFKIMPWYRKACADATYNVYSLTPERFTELTRNESWEQFCDELFCYQSEVLARNEEATRVLDDTNFLLTTVPLIATACAGYRWFGPKLRGAPLAWMGFFAWLGANALFRLVATYTKPKVVSPEDMLWPLSPIVSARRHRPQQGERSASQ